LFWSFFTTSIIKEEPLCPSRKKTNEIIQGKDSSSMLIGRSKKIKP
jgi:hypothetical protein